MKNVFLALIVAGFLMIVYTATNKLTHIEIYKMENGEKLSETVRKIEDKKGITEINEFLKKGKKVTKNRDVTKPEYAIKTSSSEYYVWLEGNDKVIFIDKKHPAVFYEDGGINSIYKYVK